MGARAAQRGFSIHASIWAAVSAFLFLIWLVTTPGGFPWFVFPIGGWGVGLAAHAALTFNREPDDDELEPGERYREIGR